MQIAIVKRYLKLPVSNTAQPARLVFRDGNRIAADLVTRLDPAQTQHFFYWDARELLGQTLEFSCTPDTGYTPVFVDTVPTDGLYGEPHRPAAHFTASRGWINDPNGAVFYEGKYHLFFQYNPVDSVWGNMHWGHAVSTDLLHWAQQDIALFPDALGTMFSGSAFVDHKNVSGLKENDHDPLLLFYTAAGGTSLASDGQKFTQCLAYSTDGGNTFRKYNRNPIVPHIAGENRDPKVVYNPEDDTYYMALYLEGHEYALLTSHNLLDWACVQRITLPDDAECPDLYPLTTASGKTYWVFSGASDRYLIGKLHEQRFEAIQPVHRLQSRGKSYAAQTFSNVPEGRILRIGWNQSRIPDSVFDGSMCIPTEMTLKEDEDGLWLCAAPVRQLTGLGASSHQVIPRELTTGSYDLFPLTGNAQDITLELRAEPDTVVCFSLLGLSVQLLPAESALQVGDVTMPVFAKDGTIRLRLITDTHAVEIFVADGETFTCIEHTADYPQNRLTVAVSSGKAALLNAGCRELRRIWR